MTKELGLKNEVKDEIGDIFLVLLHLSHSLGIDPLVAAQDKLSKLGRKISCREMQRILSKIHIL